MVVMAGLPLGAQDAGGYEQTDIEYGFYLYSNHCISCHGENGDMERKVNLRLGDFPNSPSDALLGNNIRDGIPGTQMTPTEYTEPEITALVAYVRNITNAHLGSVSLGDGGQGQALFEGKGECGRCHRVFGRGPRSAPDLSNIGSVRTGAQLERAILGSEGSTLPINRPVRVVKSDGTVINGRRINEDTFTVQLIDDHERLVSLEKATLRELTILSSSDMPSYEETLTAEERADVLAYLLSLKGLS